MFDDRKVYYSFHDIPNANTANPYYKEKIGFQFGKKELYHIFIAIGVLTIAFSFALAPYPALSNISTVLSYIPMAFLAIVTAFFCHELAHKYMGQKYGYWSEFRMYPMGLLFALFLGIFTGFIFAAPGAVQIFGMPNREETGKISVAGPFMNIVLSIMFTGISMLSHGLIASFSFFIAYINVFLALFNLIPFGMFDGAKIFAWRKDIWFLMIITGLSLFIFIIL